MNKKIMIGSIVGLFLLASCSVTKKAVSTADIQGEWDIIEVNGKPVSENQHPFIGFNTREGRIYGNSGCNRIMGSFDLSSKSGKIGLGQMASTMMACPDMELEREVLDALASVTAIRLAGKDSVALYKSGKTQVMLLRKRFTEIPLADLQGEWRLMKVYGKALPSGMESVPCLVFDISGRRISGHAGCNRLNGEFKTGEETGNAISFPAVATTRMDCPDMRTEQEVLSALDKVRSFGLLGNGNLALFDTDGNPVMELTRNK